MLEGLFPLSVGIGFLFVSSKSAKRGHDSRNWPTIPARVVSSCSGFSFQRRGKVGRYKSVWYEYTDADGDEIQSNRIRCGHQTQVNNPHVSMFFVTSQTYLGYKRGDKVEVYVDPDNCYFTVLKPGISPSAYLGLLVGVVLTAIGVWVLLH